MKAVEAVEAVEVVEAAEAVEVVEESFERSWGFFLPCVVYTSMA